VPSQQPAAQFWGSQGSAVQVPSRQDSPLAQTLPHVPQLFESLARSRQLPLQRVCPVAHPEHIPLSQDWPGWQALPQKPQLFRSLVRSWQLPKQLVSPVGHPEQFPLSQNVPFSQTLAHCPQLFESTARSWQLPLHSVSQRSHRQTPPVQVLPSPHLTPSALRGCRQAPLALQTSLVQGLPSSGQAVPAALGG